MGQRNPTLEDAFVTTDYRVLLPDGVLTLYVGHPDPMADERLRREAGVRHHWLILTPCNPLSVLANESWNNNEIIKMKVTLKAINKNVFHTLHRDQHGIWPDERGFFLADFDLESACRLGREHHQHALLYGRLGGAPELVWLTGA